MTNDQLIEKAKQFIAIPSTVDRPADLQAAIDFIASHIAQYEGITIERLESNGVPSILAYVGDTRPKTFDVLLNTHVDVVPAEDHEFIPRIADGKLYGRGGYDMKVATLTMTDTFCQIAPASPVAIGLQVVADEEVGGYNGVRYHLQKGVRAKFVVSGEMTNLGICNETRGICWAEVAFKGRRAHGGYAWDGENAVVRASDFARAIIDAYPMPTRQTWTTTANIAAITTGNSTFNRVPDDATVQIDFRFTPENHVFDSEDTVRAFVASIDPEATVTSFPVFEPAVAVPRNNPYLQQFIRAYKKATGTQAELIQRFGASDARHFAAYGIPCIEFGLAGKHLHANNEYIEISSITPFRAALETFLHEYTNHTRKTREHANSHGATTRE